MLGCWNGINCGVVNECLLFCSDNARFLSADPIQCKIVYPPFGIDKIILKNLKEDDKKEGEARLMFDSFAVNVTN